MRLFTKLILLCFSLGVFFLRTSFASASLNPIYEGVVTTPTGATVMGATVNQYSHSHPFSCTSDENGNPTGCYDLPIEVRAQRTTSTDSVGHYLFNSSADFNCVNNPQIFRTSIANGNCQEVVDNPSNFSTYRTVNVVCTFPQPSPTNTPTPTATPTPSVAPNTFRLDGSLYSNNSGKIVIYENQTVQLLNSANVIIDQNQTDQEGRYKFIITQVGTYTVRHANTPPIGFIRSGADSRTFSINLDANGVLWMQTSRTR